MAIDASPLPVRRAAKLAEDSTTPSVRWLVREVWTAQGVGFLAGAPKSWKTWLALDVALSVASNTPCLDRFAVNDPGRVLAFLAEDSPREIHARLRAICQHRNISLSALDLHFITVPLLCLHQADHRERLEATVERGRPKLLLLDPLVRVWSADENSSQEISAFLGFLRALQRTYHVAVMVVHHFTKRTHARLGQALRGSGDLWAWADDNAYLVRSDEQLVLSLEHRSAPTPKPIRLRLLSEADGSGGHLEVLPGDRAPDPTAHTALPLDQQILAALRAGAPRPLTRDALRKTLRLNNHRLGEALQQLEAQGRIARTNSGWILATIAATPNRQHSLL
ncbi:MAG: AAA family ATPase [Candidatus Krumholzibacteriia bacterium]